MLLLFQNTSILTHFQTIKSPQCLIEIIFLCISLIIHYKYQKYKWCKIHCMLLYLFSVSCAIFQNKENKIYSFHYVLMFWTMSHIWEKWWSLIWASCKNEVTLQEYETKLNWILVLILNTKFHQVVLVIKKPN
jgi:hypothetical protein